VHAGGDWQAVEGVLSKDMATVGEYQTWKLKLSTTKMVSAACHLNNKEAKRELKDNFINETLPFYFEPKSLGVSLRPTQTDNPPILAGIQPAESFVAMVPHCL